MSDPEIEAAAEGLAQAARDAVELLDELEEDLGQLPAPERELRHTLRMAIDAWEDRDQ